MTIFGLGGFEVMVIAAIALFVLGPKRLLEGIREGRRMYTDLKRQRQALQSMITEAIDMEDLGKQIDLDGMNDSVKSVGEKIRLDQLLENSSKRSAVGDEQQSPKPFQVNRKTQQINKEMREAISDLDLTGKKSQDIVSKSDRYDFADDAEGAASVDGKDDSTQ